jgi:hypothetical protein
MARLQGHFGYHYHSRRSGCGRGRRIKDLLVVYTIKSPLLYWQRAFTNKKESSVQQNNRSYCHAPWACIEKRTTDNKELFIFG